MISADLNAEAIRVDIAESDEEAVYLMRDHTFNLLLINLLLRDINGSALVSRIRSVTREAPIITLSAIPQASWTALAAGTDDVVECDMERAELAARVRATVRRTRSRSQSQLQVGNLTLDVKRHNVVANSARVHFSAKELVFVCSSCIEHVVTKEAILSQLFRGIDQPENQDDRRYEHCLGPRL